jgi:hypothetical protein
MEDGEMYVEAHLAEPFAASGKITLQRSLFSMRTSMHRW